MAARQCPEPEDLPERDCVPSAPRIIYLRTPALGPAKPAPKEHLEIWKAMRPHARTPRSGASQPSVAARALARRRVLWGLLAASVLLLGFAWWYGAHVEAGWDAKPAGGAAVPTLWSQSSGEVRRPAFLRLEWEPVPSASEYRLSVCSISGRLVVDRLRVAESSWLPPDEALPALTRGEYVWAVEAIAPDGTVLGRTVKSAFRIGEPGTD